MEIIKELFSKYIQYYERLNEMSAGFYSFQPREEWKTEYEKFSMERNELYGKTTLLYQQLESILDRPLEEETAEAFYQAIIHVDYEGIRDYLFLTKILEKLVPYYENSEDAGKIIRLNFIYHYEINEVKRRQFSIHSIDFTYLDRILSYKDNYASFEDEDVRLLFWKSYYHKIVVALEHRLVLVADAYACALEMNALWDTPMVQKLDGNNAIFAKIVEDIRIKMINSMYSLNPGDTALCKRFEVAVNRFYQNAMKLVKSEYELPPLIFAGNLFVRFVNKKSDINQIFEDYMEYYLYRCVLYQDEECPSMEAIAFYQESVDILETWVRLGVDSEKRRKMVGCFMVLMQKKWRNIPDSLWPYVNKLMKKLCNAIIQFGSTEAAAEQCLISVLVSRDFILFLHSKMVERIALLIAETLYDEKSPLIAQYHKQRKEEFLRKISMNAMLHDCGKNDLAELIYMNNRPWTEEEERYIQEHTIRAADYMAQFTDLKQYRDVVIGHHKDYDGKGGYPKDYDNTSSNQKFIVDLIHLADQIDDVRNQHYAIGKECDFEEIFTELLNGKGTKYHPALVELIENSPKVREKLKELLLVDGFDNLYDIVMDIDNRSISKNFDGYLGEVEEKYNEALETGKLDDYKPYLDKLFQIAAKENTNRCLGISYFYMMKYHFVKKDYMNSISCGHEAVRYLENSEEYFYLCEIYHLLGRLMNFQGNSENGLGYFLKSIEYGRRCEGNPQTIGTAYCHVADILKESRFYERAIYYYDSAQTYLSKDGELLIMIFCNKSFCYVMQKDTESVIRYHDLILSMKKQLSHESFGVYVYLAYADYFLGNTKEMNQALYRATEEFERIQDLMKHICEIHVYINLLEMLGRYEEMAERLEKCIDYFERGQIHSQFFGKIVHRRIQCGHLMNDVKSIEKFGKYLYQNAELTLLDRQKSALQIEKAYLENIKVQREQREVMRKNRTLEQEVAVAEQANAEKSSFLTSMSHEIRTPIHAIIGLDEMILRESNEENILQYASDIHNAGKTLMGIISDVLDFSKMESGKMEIIPEHYRLLDLIQDLKNMIESRAKDKGLEFRIFCEPDTPKGLYGDDLRIKQVILNILTNAVKYTNEGYVDFSISYKKLDKENISLKISVKDTGMGMKKEDLERLTVPFTRFDEQKNRNIEGTGLGMSIVKSLVKELKGILQVESEYGKGSSFTVEIPQMVTDWTEIGDIYEKRKVVNEHKEALFTAPNAEILLVDDNAVNLKVVSSLLKRTKVKVTCAKSGKECLKLCEEKKFDMILLDHRMPEMDGVETLEILRKMKGQNSLIPVIALTANAVSGAADFYREKGFDELVTKPVNHMEMERKMKNLLPRELVEQV